MLNTQNDHARPSISIRPIRRALRFVGLATLLAVAACASPEPEEDSASAEAATRSRSAPKSALSGTYGDGAGNTIILQDGQAILSSAGGDLSEATLTRDGTLGASYTLRFPEGFVCGSYQLSLWVAEGQVGDGSTFSIKWNAPSGSVVSQCGDMKTAEGRYKRASMFGGRYENRAGAAALVAGGKAFFHLPDGGKVEGDLEREGTMGGSYVIRVPEGSVCGTYQISLWASEGVLGDGSTFKSTWLPPDGSVVTDCLSMRAGEGLFVK